MPLPSPASRLLRAIDRDLTDAGITLRPGVTGVLPPLWMEPAEGVPAPGEGTAPAMHPETVVGMFHSGGIAGQGWERQIVVDVWIRTKGNGAALRALDMEQQIRDRLLLPSDMVDGERHNFTLAPATEHSMRIIGASVFRELQRLDSSAGQGMTYLAGYRFQCYSIEPVFA